LEIMCRCGFAIARHPIRVMSALPHKADVAGRWFDIS
jgi:hypothetical protein